MYEAILLSLKITGISTLITGISGILTAYIFTKYNFKFKNILETVILMPMALPPTVVGYLIILIIGKRGFLGQFLYKFFGVNIYRETLFYLTWSFLFEISFNSCSEHDLIQRSSNCEYHYDSVTTGII